MVEDFPLPRKKEFLFRYGVMELNTAVKPWMFAHLKALGYQHVVYLDPDILVLDRLDDVERLLDEGATGVLLPHLTAPIDDGRRPAELDIMRSGTYNLGFLGLGRYTGRWPVHPLVEEQARVRRRFRHRTRALHGSKVDGPRARLVRRLRDPAGSGIRRRVLESSHRPVARAGGGWTAAGRPLRFFHFSGFNPENPKPFSKHQNRFDLDTIGQARELALEYAARVLVTTTRAFA